MEVNCAECGYKHPKKTALPRCYGVKGCSITDSSIAIPGKIQGIGDLSAIPPISTVSVKDAERKLAEEVARQKRGIHIISPFIAGKTPNYPPGYLETRELHIKASKNILADYQKNMEEQIMVGTHKPFLKLPLKASIIKKDTHLLFIQSYIKDNRGEISCNYCDAGIGAFDRHTVADEAAAAGWAVEDGLVVCTECNSI